MGSTTKSTPTNSNTQATEPRFELGQLCYTPGAQEALPSHPITAARASCGWRLGRRLSRGRETNEEAIQEGSRIFSVYILPPPSSEGGSSTAKVWVITEADRSVTTILLPEEY